MLAERRAPPVTPSESATPTDRPPVYSEDNYYPPPVYTENSSPPAYPFLEMQGEPVAPHYPHLERRNLPFAFMSDQQSRSSMVEPSNFGAFRRGQLQQTASPPQHLVSQISNRTPPLRSVSPEPFTEQFEAVRNIQQEIARTYRVGEIPGFNRNRSGSPPPNYRRPHLPDITFTQPHAEGSSSSQSGYRRPQMSSQQEQSQARSSRQQRGPTGVRAHFDRAIRPIAIPRRQYSVHPSNAPPFDFDSFIAERRLRGGNLPARESRPTNDENKRPTRE